MLRSPSSFRGDATARQSPLFESIGRELGGSPERKATTLSALLKSRWIKTRLLGPAGIFTLTDNQFEGCAQTAGFSQPCEVRKMVEEYTGYSFQSCTVSAPETAEQENTSNQHGKGHQTIEKDNTISDQLGVAGCCRVALPQTIIGKYLAMVPDSENTEVNEKIFGPASTDIAVWMYCMTGKWNWGSLLDRKLGQQMSFYLPKLEPISPGKPRGWQGVFSNKHRLLGRNDVAVRERALKPSAQGPHASCPTPRESAARVRKSHIPSWTA
jgi:hypothetical protein